MNLSECLDVNLGLVLKYLNENTDNEYSLVGCKMNSTDLEEKILSLSSLRFAEVGHLSFWTDGTSILELKNSKASFILVPLESKVIKDLQDDRGESEGKVFVEVENPYRAMIQIAQFFKTEIANQKSYEKSIDKTARVHSSAVIEGVVQKNAVIGPNCYVGPRSVVGEDSVLESGVNIYEDVKIGKGCVLQSGSVIGSRGFGFRNIPSNKGQSKRLLAVPHFGGVILSSEVQIGANSVVASGFLEPTTLGERSCVDSLVQIGHNVTLGSDCYMASQSGIAGSTTLGKGVRVAGGAQISGHLKIGDGATVTAKAGVTRSVEAGVMVSGYPAMEHGLWKHLIVKFRSGY
jgi:UDP-3-O-[3-hydroxymyristoyl] glucosamine N-acyltransferase